MLEPLLSALQAEDFQKAEVCLAALEAREPDSLWVTFGTARLHEAAARWEAASHGYRQLLQQATNHKLILQARQGIARVEASQAERHAAAVSAARSSGSSEPGLLFLSAIAPAAKPAAARHLAKIVGIDAYTARLRLPSQGLRPLQMGPLGELDYLAQLLQGADIPCFCCPQSAIAEPQVLSVVALELERDRAIACDRADRRVAFAWSEVGARVLGAIPIAGEIVKIDPRAEVKTSRKTDTLDYAHCCDLHLPARQTILRLCDRRYDFSRQGRLRAAKPDDTGRSALLRTQWNRLLADLAAALPTATPTYANFGHFAGAVKDDIGFHKFLLALDARIDLGPERRQSGTTDPAREKQDALWDGTFAFYSASLLYRGQMAARA